MPDVERLWHHEAWVQCMSGVCDPYASDGVATVVIRHDAGALRAAPFLRALLGRQDAFRRQGTAHYIQSLTSLRHARVCCVSLMIGPTAFLIPAGVATPSAARVDVKLVREACLLNDRPEGGLSCGATADVSCVPSNHVNLGKLYVRQGK
jgi:hypothetical protein